MSIFSFNSESYLYPDGGPPIVISTFTEPSSSSVIVEISRPRWHHLNPNLTTLWWDDTIPKGSIDVVKHEAWRYKMRFHANVWYSAESKYYLLEDAFGCLTEKHPEIEEWLKRLATHESSEGTFTVPGTHSQKPDEVDKLPGRGARVKHPVRGSEYRLFAIIVDLNDEYKWSRERIADWLETLDIDLEFKGEA